MTRSRRWFEYIGDNGTSYAVELDESNSEANIQGIRLCGDLDGSEGLLPGRLRMRYVNTVLSTDSLIRKRFWVGSQALYNSIEPADAIGDDGQIWSILSKRGERSAFPNLIDTAQNDGDAPN